MDSAPITTAVMATAIDLQRALAHWGWHRVSIPDLIISAAAKHSGLVVLHYDADFESIAKVGGPDHEWVVPKGSDPRELASLSDKRRVEHLVTDTAHGDGPRIPDLLIRRQRCSV